jgi:hypothetical protein
LDRLKVDGEELVEVDYNSCHIRYLPNLLDNGLTKDSLLRQLNEGDIYENFVEKGVTREQVKGSFQKFLAGKTWGDRVAQKYLTSFKSGSNRFST